MLAPRSRVRAGRAIAISIASICLAGGLARSVGAQVDNHSEQGAEPPPGYATSFDLVQVLAGHGPLMAAPGPGLHGFDTWLYVLLIDHDTIVRVNPSGITRRFVRLPHLAVGNCTPLTFDVQGKFGGGLLFGGRYTRIGRISASGSISFIGSPGLARSRCNGRATRGLECDPYGLFGGRLFLADHAGAIFEVDDRGRMELLTNGRRTVAGGEGGNAMAVSPGGLFGAFLYIADRAGRRILRISPEHSPGDAASVWLDLADTHIEPTGLAISTSGPFGTDVIYVLDGLSDRVLGFDADGSYRGPIASGVKEQSSIELPRTGVFKDMMVIVSNDSITVLRSAGTTGFDDPPALLGDLDNDDDVDEMDLFGLLDDLECAGPGCAGDLNTDGRTDVQDIHMFLAVMFEGD